MANETILVIDSEETCRLLKIGALSPAGYRVLSATDPQIVLMVAQSDPPDLILLDPEFCGGDGLGLLGAIRETGCFAPAILMTSIQSGDFGIETFRLGIQDALDKPFSREQICRAINRALNEVRLAREREKLSQTLQAAEVVRMTVITLSHYINNNLMAISGVLTLLEEALHQEKPIVDLVEILENGQENLKGIQTVLKVLRQTTDVELSLYSNATPMIDIEALLHRELLKVHKTTKKLSPRID